MAHQRIHRQGTHLVDALPKPCDSSDLLIPPPQVPAALVRSILAALHHATEPAEQLLASLGGSIAASVPPELVRLT